jgi:hypothetical protein
MIMAMMEPYDFEWKPAWGIKLDRRVILPNMETTLYWYRFWNLFVPKSESNHHLRLDQAGSQFRIPFKQKEGVGLPVLPRRTANFKNVISTFGP